MTLRDPKSDREWRATIGFDNQRFTKLLGIFEEAYISHFGKTMEVRLADCPGDATFSTYRDLLFFTLFSLKSGMGYDILGYMLGIDISNAKRNQTLGLTILKRALGDIGCMPVREFESVGEFQDYFEQHKKMIIDGTEQRFQRPKEKEMQKGMYSGKKSTHGQVVDYQHYG